MAAARAFMRKYWIFIVIVLWVIAWANRDWLAGGPPSSENTYAEAERLAEPSEPAQPSDASATDAAPVSAAHDGAIESEASPGGAPRVGAFESTPMAQETTAADTGAKQVDVGSMPEADPVSVSGVLAKSELDAPVATSDATSPEADAMVVTRERSQASVAASENVGRDGSSDVGDVGAPEAGSPDDKDDPVASAERQAELLARARAVARSRGPLAAAEVLDQGLRELPSTAPGRADLYGEMGNYQFTARNFTAALAAYDMAVKTLPADERSVMLRRLAPIYDRYHPDGRSHLEQFR